MAHTRVRGYYFPDLVAHMPSFIDQSWGNDMMDLVSFTSGGHAYGMWVDDEDPDEREYDDLSRYVLFRIMHIGPYLELRGMDPSDFAAALYEAFDQEGSVDIVLETEHPAEVEEYVREHILGLTPITDDDDWIV